MLFVFSARMIKLFFIIYCFLRSIYFQKENETYFSLLRSALPPGPAREDAFNPQPSPKPGTYLLNPQPSPKPGTYLTNPQSSPKPGTYLLNPQPSPKPGTYLLNPQPSPKPGTYLLNPSLNQVPTYRILH